jgi:plasmid maintenance system antidote protein VapI
MALRLGKLCGSGAGLWLRTLHAYDLWHAERAPWAEIATILTAQGACGVGAR